MRRLIAGFLLLPALARGALAQGDCFPGPDSHEAKTLASFAVPLAFSPGGAPARRAGFSLGVEAASIPGVDPVTATPTICRPGKGPEHTDLLPVLPRPRLGLPMPLGLALELSWIPPVRVNGIRSNLVGLSLGRSVGWGDGIVLAVRAHATLGSLRAPVTCDDRALADATSECYGGQHSDDRLQPNIVGADLALGIPLLGGRLRPYGGAGFTLLRPRFQVHFVNQAGALDNRRVSVNLERVALFGGATWVVTQMLGVSAELYAVPADRVSARVVIRTSLGPRKEASR